jgi:hypothetical protein
MYSRIIPFLYENKILPEAQNGFRKGKSIDKAVQSFIGRIQKALAKQVHATGIFIDLTKVYPYHHHHITFLELGHLLTRSGLTYPEVSSEVYHDSFCQLGSSVSLPWVIYFEAFYLHIVSSFSCIPVNCPKLVLFLTPLQFVHLFCSLPILNHKYHKLDKRVHTTGIFIDLTKA